MTRIDFYVLPDSDPQATRAYACRLAAKAWQQGLSVYLLTAPEQEQTLDDLLWQFQSMRFLPHRRLSDASLPAAPIELGSTEPPQQHHGLLINLAEHIPDWFSRFDRVAEIVCQQDAALARLRQHYRHYQSFGYPLETHRIGHAQA